MEREQQVKTPTPESPFLLTLDSPDATLERAGGKGASLARLAAAGLPVPPGFCITTDAYHRFVSENHLTDAILAAAERARADDPASLEHASAQILQLIGQGTIPDDIAGLIRQWYGDMGGGDPPVAVRSSATAEDLPEMSFAGQLETILNVRGGENVLESVRRCWASLWTPRALGYRARHGIQSEDVSVAVVVQQLVPADVAGILFTANPLTGARGQVMINAAWGLGEAIVGGRVTPDTIVVDAQTGAIASHEIADKQVMTVRLPEGTREAPVPPDRRTQAALQPHQAAELARLGALIEQLYGQPMDVEWAMHNGRVFILQARPITALPQPPAALDWTVPRAGGSYWRSSVIELLPDPLSPLFATLALPLWDDAMLGLMRDTEFARLMPGRMLITINGYAYYDFGVGLGVSQVARMFVALIQLVPRGVGWLRRAHTRWADEARPRYAGTVDAWSVRNLGATPALQLLAGAREIVRAAAEHYVTIQSSILPVAYMSEALFTNMYNRLIKRKTDPPALTFLLGFDSAPIQAEKSLYDLAVWVRKQPALADWVTHTTGKEIASAYESSSAPIPDVDSWREFTRRLAEHLNRFGHAVYDLDFAKSVPADDPAPLVEALRYFVTGQGRSPFERQSAAASAREHARQSVLARVKGPRRRWFTRLLETAQRYAPLREDALADVGLGWPLLRRMFREIGRRLAAATALAERDDVFWLEWEEVEAAARALDAGQPAQDFRRVIAERRATWEREHRVTPPVTLPIKGGGRFMGIDFTGWMPARTDQAAGDTIKGIGASPGRVVGIARVIHAPGEFSQMRHGDILVARITTPAWTPLFALASGVVTDVGGPLSHSSIVAREYHIPAVLGTGLATERLHSGEQITVDGDRGVVTLQR